MRKFSWYTTPVKVGECTVYKYAVDRYIPNRVNRSGFGSYIHVKAGTFVTAHDGDIRRVRFSCDYKWISWGNMRTCESSCITHLMPQPKTPEVK